MKLRDLVVLLSMGLIGLGSAHAATVFIPGVSGIADLEHAGAQAGGKNVCVPDVPTGRMLASALPVVYNECFMSFPINLPVGTTIDGVEIAYRADTNAIPRFMNAALGTNRIKPYMGPVALGAAFDSAVPTNQQLYTNMGSMSVPILNGDIFWVQVSTENVTEVDYVAVTYH